MNFKKIIISFILVFILCGIAVVCMNKCTTNDLPVNNVLKPTDSYVANVDAILSVEEVNEIDGMLGQLENSTTIQFYVVVLNSIGEKVAKDFANQLFNQWKVGKVSTNNGLLFLVVMDQHRMELETGYGIEGILPDIICKRVQIEDILPSFKAGEPGVGIVKGINSYCRILKNESDLEKSINQQTALPENIAEENRLEFEPSNIEKIAKINDFMKVYSLNKFTSSDLIFCAFYSLLIIGYLILSTAKLKKTVQITKIRITGNIKMLPKIWLLFLPLPTTVQLKKKVLE